MAPLISLGGMKMSSDLPAAAPAESGADEAEAVAVQIEPAADEAVAAGAHGMLPFRPSGEPCCRPRAEGRRASREGSDQI